MPIQDNDEILAAAIEGLEAKKDAIDAQITELRQMMTGGDSGTAMAVFAPGTGARRTL